MNGILLPLSLSLSLVAAAAAAAAAALRNPPTSVHVSHTPFTWLTLPSAEPYFYSSDSIYAELQHGTLTQREGQQSER